MNYETYKRNPIISAMDKAFDIFIIFNLVTIATLVCTQVFLRYVLRMPLMGIEELCYFPTVWLYLGAAVKASSEKGQLVARVLEIFLKKQRQVFLLRGFASVVAGMVLCWLTYWGYDLFKYSMRLQKQTDTLFLPWPLIECSVFFCMALMLFYTVVEVWEYIKGWRAIDASEPKFIEEITS